MNASKVGILRHQLVLMQSDVDSPWEASGSLSSCTEVLAYQFGPVSCSEKYVLCLNSGHAHSFTHMFIQQIVMNITFRLRTVHLHLQKYKYFTVQVLKELTVWYKSQGNCRKNGHPQQYVVNSIGEEHHVTEYLVWRTRIYLWCFPQASEKSEGLTDGSVMEKESRE